MTENTVKNYYCWIQKDVDIDGFMDVEASYETIYNNVEITTYTKELTVTFPASDLTSVSPASEELRVSTYISSTMSQTLTFADLVNGEEVSTRVYEDAFPNGLAEVCSVSHYVLPVSGESGSSQTTDLNALVSLSHAQDFVPAEFDKVTTIENGQITTENLLYESQTIEIPGTYSYNDVGFDSYTIDAIKVIPSDGTYWINDPKTASVSSKDDDGYYLYFDSDDDSVFETVFVMDKFDNVVGIGFDYVQDAIFEPGATTAVEKNILWSKSYDDCFISDEYIHFKETDKEVGVFSEPTFSDVLFDVHKMAFTGKSELMREAEQVADNLYAEQVWTNLIVDVVVQTLASTFAFVGGAIASYFSGFNPLVGGVAFMINYLAITLPYQYIQIAEQKNYYAHRTYRLEGSSDRTLGQMFWFDDMYANMMPITLFGSIGGIYSPVYGQTKKSSYSADLVLRGFDFFESKASTFLGTSYSYPKLDYWLSTRNIMGYSYFGGGEGGTVFEFLQDKNVINPEIDIGIPEYNHAYSSAYFLEYQLKKDISKHGDANLDTIVPIIDYDYANGRFTPRYSFVDSLTFANPEFYTEYPVFVEEGSSKVNQYVSIYKQVAVEDPKTATFIEFSVFEPNCELKVDVMAIDAWVIWKKTTDPDDPNDKETTVEYSFVGSFPADQFGVNMSTGAITISSSEGRGMLEPLLNALEKRIDKFNDDDSDTIYEGPYLLFQIKVEKYRSIADLRDNMTEKQANTIATAQAVEAAILEYNYQYSLAMQTRLSYGEILYTLTITAISTALSIVASAGVGQAISACSSTSKIVGSDWYMIVQRLTSFTAASLIGTVVKEMAQEVLLDPWMESAISGMARRAGWNAYIQATLSSLAESGRESLTGITSYRQWSDIRTQVKQTLEAKNSGRTTTRQEVFEATREIITQMETQQTESQDRLTNLRSSHKAISFVAKAIGATVSAFFGPVAALAYSTVAAYCITEGISLKNLFRKVFVSRSSVGASSETVEDRKVTASELIERLGEEGYKFGRLAASSVATMVPSRRSNTHLMDTYNPKGSVNINPDYIYFSELFKDSYGILNQDELEKIISNYFEGLTLSDLKEVIGIYEINAVDTENAITKKEFVDRIGNILADRYEQLRPPTATGRSRTKFRKDYLSKFLTMGVNWAKVTYENPRMKSYRKIFVALNEKIQDVKLFQSLVKEIGLVKASIFNSKKNLEFSRITEALQDLYALYIGSEKADFERSWFSEMLYTEGQSDRYMTDLQNKGVFGDEDDYRAGTNLPTYLKLEDKILTLKQSRTEIEDIDDFKEFQKKAIALIRWFYIQNGFVSLSALPAASILLKSVHLLHDNNRDSYSGELVAIAKAQSYYLRGLNHLGGKILEDIKVLMKGLGTKESQGVVKLIDEYKQLYMTKHMRPFHVGILSHMHLEDIDGLNFGQLGIRNTHEAFSNYPDSLHRIDTLLKTKGMMVNKRILESLGLSLDGINEIAVDYTMLSSKNFHIIEKLFKHYQQEDRLLFIVVYGDSTTQLINSIQSQIEATNVEFKDNCRLITLAKYMELFGFKAEYISLMQEVSDLASQALTNNNEYEQLQSYRIRPPTTLSNWL